MTARLVSAALLLALVACTPGRAAIAAGASTLMLGGMSFAAGAPNSSCTGSDSCGLTEGFFDSIGDDFNEGQRDLGAAMMVTGAVLVLLGLVAESHRSDDDAAMAPVTYAPMQRTLSAPGATAYIVLDEPPVVRRASPAELAMRSRLENRLALQASSAARRGDCAGAVASSVKLAEVDPVMHAELVRTDADLADCLARVAAQN